MRTTKTLLPLLFAPFATCLDSSHKPNADIISRDVVIIGGGSSGSYSAIRLHQLGKSVALVEKEGRLGGHTNTYFDAATNKTFDYGTQILVNTSEVRNFFAYLNVPLAPFRPGGSSVYVDLNNGVPASPPSNATASSSALDRYQVQLAKYPGIFRGYDLPDPVPEDLLITWGDFLTKYDLGPLAYDGFLQFQGSGNILAQPTLYLMKLFNPTQVQARIQKTKVSEANGDTQALWNAAQNVLGADAILNSKITRVTRSAAGVEVVVATPNGVQVIHAKKILITVPPKLEVLAPFLDLSVEETSVFGQLNNSYYYNAVVANTNFPVNTSVYNYNTKAAFGIPALPGPYYFTATGVSNLYAVQYSSPYFTTDDEVKADILKSIEEARQTLGYSEPSEATQLKAFNNHSPFGLTVSAEKIAAGYYKKYTALQGPRNTFWTGASWSSGSSSTIWDFTENELLPKLLASLG